MTSIDEEIAVEVPRTRMNAAGWLWVPIGAAVVTLLVVATAYGLVQLALWSEQYRPPIVTALVADGSFILPADMASMQGDALILQESGDQTFIKWTDVYGSASWRFFVPSSGAYDITLTYSCAEGAQGSDLLIDVAGSELEIATISTGDWDTWETRTLSQLPLGRGVHQVHVKAASMAGDEVMRLRAIEISPVGEIDNQEVPVPEIGAESEVEVESETLPEEPPAEIETGIDLEISDSLPEVDELAPEIPDVEEGQVQEPQDLQAPKLETPTIEIPESSGIKSIESTEP